MKFFRILAVFEIIAMSCAQAQMSNIYQDEQFSISRIYAGVNSTTIFPTDSIGSYADINFRLGLRSALTFSERMVLKTWGAIQMSKNQPVAGFNSFELMILPVKNLSWHFGLIATPTTVLRPNPTTWESHVETRAQRTIIPGRPGTKLTYVMNSNANLTYGYFNHNGQGAHHLNVTVWQWSIAGYRLNNDYYFTAIEFRSSRLENIITYSSEEELASSSFVKVKGEISLVLDGQYALDKKELLFFQTGIRKYISAASVHLSGFFGLSYDWTSQLVIGQIFMNLN